MSGNPRFGVLAAGLLVLAAVGAGAAAPTEAILGTWRGTSTCVGNPDFPACHDEVVVYEFRNAAAQGAVTAAAFRIANGEKLLMGELDFTYDARQGAWISELQTPRAHGLWAFVVSGNAMTGTFVDLPAKHLVRNVAAKKDASDSRK